jgi:hypothetical protein
MALLAFLMGVEHTISYGGLLYMLIFDMEDGFIPPKGVRG